MTKKITALSLGLLLVAAQGCCFKPCAKKCAPVTQTTIVTEYDKETYNPATDCYQIETTIVDATVESNEPIQFADEVINEEINLDEIIVDEMDMLPAFQAENVQD